MDDLKQWYCHGCKKYRHDDYRGRRNHESSCDKPPPPPTPMFSGAQCQELKREISARNSRDKRNQEDNARYQLRCDQFSAISSGGSHGTEGLEPFRFNLQCVAGAIKKSGRKLDGNRVTDFTNEIYRTYQSKPSQSSLEMGKAGEKVIPKYWSNLREHGPRALESGDWRLAYEGKSLRISELTVDGRELWGEPDVVFVNDATKELLIIERKVTTAVIPKNGWPNLCAQLWAYSRADEFRDYNVRAVGEIWHASWLALAVPSGPPVVISYEVRSLDLAISPLFELLGGKILREEA